MPDNEKTVVTITNKDNKLNVPTSSELLKSLREDQKSAIAETAFRNAIELQKKAEEAEIDRDNSVRDIQQHIATVRSIQSSESSPLKRNTVITNIKTASGNMKLEYRSGGQCFVATATYCDAWHPDVVFLRHYRDTVLCKSIPGRLFIRTYYRVGPWLAIPVRKYGMLRRLSLKFLTALVARLRAKYDC